MDSVVRTQLIGGALMTAVGVVLLVIYLRTSMTPQEGFETRYLAAIGVCLLFGPLALAAGMYNLVTS